MRYSALDIALDREPVSRGAHFGRFCLMMAVLQGIGLLVTLGGILQIARRANELPAIVAFTADARPATGKLAPLVTTDQRFLMQCRDVTEAALSRTENGTVPELANFVTPAAAKKLARDAGDTKPRGKAPFTQIFEVASDDGVRVVSGNALRARAMVHGFMTTRTTAGIIRNELFWAAEFFNLFGSPENPLGWRLNDLFPIDQKQFYAADLAKAAADAVKLPPDRRP